MTFEMRVRRLSPICWLALIAAALFGGGCQKQVSDRKIEVVTLAQAADLHERSTGKDSDVLFIDARRAPLFAGGSIQGAINMRPDDVDLRIGTDPKLTAKEALVVFGEDPSSAVARAMCKRLIQAGYNSMFKSRVKFYPGGYAEWLATGLPVTEPAPVEEPASDPVTPAP